MKRKLHTYLLAFLAVGSLALGACSKDDDNGGSGGGNNTTPNSIGANIDGTAFNQEKVVLDYQSSNQTLSITGYDKDQVTTIALTFSLNSSGSTQTIGAGAYGAVQLDQTVEGLYDGTMGTITLSKNDKSARIVQGTFEFQATNSNSKSIQVTSGTFYAKY